MPEGVNYNSLDVKDAKVIQTFKSAKENGKNVVVIFDAVWCGVCCKFNQQTMKDPEVLKTLADFEVINVDAEKFPEVAKKLGRRAGKTRIRSVPTVMIFSSDGIQADEFIGFYDGKRFNEVLKRSL